MAMLAKTQAVILLKKKITKNRGVYSVSVLMKKEVKNQIHTCVQRQLRPVTVSV